MRLIALHGLQGSGKTTHAELLSKFLPNPVRTGIKAQFDRYVNHTLQGLGVDVKTPNGLQAKKQLQLAISTWGETYVDQDIWCNELYKQLEAGNKEWLVAGNDISAHFIIDDIRTPQNWRLLERVAADLMPVFFFRLQAPEEVRKERVSVYRPNGGYTEKLLEQPASLGPNLVWTDINTSRTIEECHQQILSTINDLNYLIKG